MLRKSFSELLNRIKKYYHVCIAGIYIGGLLLFGEVHPFSTFPMYNSFPNWSYAFYFTDEKDELVPTQEFGMTSADVGHLFYSICEDENINYGDARESPEILHHVGKKMLEACVKQQVKETHSLSLHRIFFSYQKGKMVKIDTVIYEKSNY